VSTLKKVSFLYVDANPAQPCVSFAKYFFSFVKKEKMMENKN